MRSRIPRVAMIVSHPIQYFGPLYRKVAEDGRVDLLVIFGNGGAEARYDRDFGQMVKWQEDILEGYAHRIVRAEKEQRPAAVVEELEKFQPDVVHANGYHLPYTRAALRWAHRNGRATMLATDSELLHPRPLHVRAAKRVLLPRIFRLIDQFLTTGDENGRYFKHYGASEDRFLRLSYPVDSPCYDQYLERRDEVRRAVRARLGLAEETSAILCVGKLIERKAQADLIGALEEVLESGRRSAAVLLAGDGPDRAKLEEVAKPVASRVHFLGFVNVEQLPEYYIAADIYAHPSTEDPHPIAISEALYCSLPVVVSSLVGSTGPTDDVQPGRNGWVYPATDVGALAGVLAELIDHPEKRAAAAKVSRELGLLHRTDYLAGQLILGAERAMAVRASRLREGA